MGDKNATLQVEISLGEIFEASNSTDENGGMTVSDVILQIAADRLLDMEIPPDEDTRTEEERKYSRTRIPVRTGVTSELRKRIGVVRDEEIRRRVSPMVDEALSVPVRMTNEFGEPRGEPTTLRELIISMAKKELTASPGSRTGRDQKGTLLEQAISAAVQKEVRGELQTALQEAKEEVRAMVTAQGAQLITETIERLSGASRA